MKKVYLLFPGQGSQYVGMASKLQPHELDELDDALGYGLSHTMKDGPEDVLKLTQNTQPAIVSHSVSLFKNLALPLIEKRNWEIAGVLGHSVGEYSALIAAESLSLKDGLRAVHFRGKYMQDAVPEGLGAMAAIMRADHSQVETLCQEVSTAESSVEPANYNDPGQLVISGHKEAVARACEKIQTSIPRARAIPLKVSAPFHCSLMQPAAEKLKELLKEISFQSPRYSYIANIDAQIKSPSISAEEIKDNLYRQVCGSVQWLQSISHIPADSICFEVGPGKVLKGLLKKINPDLKVFSLDTEEDYNEALTYE